MKIAALTLMSALSTALLAANVSPQVHSFRGGVRIPAGSCATYSNTPKAEMVSSSGGLVIYNFDGRIDVNCVCQLPVPEKARIRQFAIVGNVSKGVISAMLGGVREGAPRQSSAYASVSLKPRIDIPVIRQRNQNRVVQNLPVSGPKSLTIDRAETYFIEARFKSDSAVSIEEALELFYFEVYWD